MFIYYFLNGNEYHVFLVFLTFISIFFVNFGYLLSKSVGVVKIPKVIVDVGLYFNIVMICFLLYVFYVFYSFGGIPLISVFQGSADPDIIRGEFFKGREGFEKIVIYLGGILIYIFVPLAIVLSLEFKLKFKYFFLFFSIFYCVVTLQKALLLNVLFPVVYFYFTSGVVSKKKIFSLIFIVLLYFIVMISLSGHADDVDSGSSIMLFFTSDYIPSGPLDYLLWRAFAVPVYTAVDTLIVFDLWLNNQFLKGASSSLLSVIFNLERVDIEKIVFEYQFGGFNFFANANAFFAVGLYTDFNFVGLIVFSIFLGIGISSVEKTKSIALNSIAFLLIYLLFNVSLIGTLLSSGYLYLFLHSFFIKFKEKQHG